MSRTKSFFSGALFTYLYQGGAMFVGIWLTPFYIHSLGTKDFGVWLVGLQVLTFLLLIDFGIIGVMPRDVGHAAGAELSEGGSDRLSLLMGQTVKVVLAQTVIVAIACLGLFLFGRGTAASLRGPVGLILLVFTISYPLRIFPATLQGLQDLSFLGQLRLCLWALATALTVVLLMTGARFYALAWGWCFQQMGHDLVAAIRLRRL